MKIYRVTGVVVVRADDRLIVQVSGLSASPGWTAISLKVDDPNPEDRVLEFALDGTAPGGITIQVLTPVSASVVVPAETVDAILVKARTNSVEVHASEFQAVGKPITTFAIASVTFSPVFKYCGTITKSVVQIQIKINKTKS